MDLFGLLAPPILMIAVLALAFFVADRAAQVFVRRTGNRLLQLLLYLVFTVGSCATIAVFSSPWWPLWPLIVFSWILPVLICGVALAFGHTSQRTTGRHEIGAMSTHRPTAKERPTLPIASHQDRTS